LRRSVLAAEAGALEVEGERTVVSVDVEVRREDIEMDGRGDAIVDMLGR